MKIYTNLIIRWILVKIWHFFGWDLGIWKINVINKKEKSNQFSRPRVWTQGISGKITNDNFFFLKMFSLQVIDRLFKV